MFRHMTIALLCFLWTSPAFACDFDGHRVKSYILRYLFPPSDSSRHDMVEVIIVRVAHYIRDSLNSESEDFAYLNGVGFYPDGGHQVSSPDLLDELWNHPQCPALTVLHGHIEADEVQGRGFLVSSYIFIGDLPARAGLTGTDNLFYIEANTTLSDYGRLSDAHGYVLVYALILDAIATGRGQHVVFELLDTAFVIRSELEERGSWPPELHSIYLEILDIENNL